MIVDCFVPYYTICLIESDYPTLEELSVVVLPQRDIVSQWEQLALYLLDKQQYFISNNPDPVQSCISMFKDWLAGKGKPATWTVLIQALNKMRLYSACSRIRTMLKGT